MGLSSVSGLPCVAWAVTALWVARVPDAKLLLCAGTLPELNGKTGGPVPAAVPPDVRLNADSN